MTIIRPVPGMPGITADSAGHIYRDGVLTPERLDLHGYIIVIPRPGQRGRRAQLVCRAFHGPKPADKDVCAHHNDIKVDDRPENLYWATFSENLRDAIRNGRKSAPPAIDPRPYTQGERNGNAKLTDVAVQAIRADYATGRFTHRQLAAQYGVSHSRVGEVLRGKTWAHVPLGSLP